MNTKKIIISILLIAGTLLSISCAGSRSTLKFSKLEYPTSLSYSLYDRSGQVVSIGNGLTQVAQFEFKETLWSIGWSFIPITNNAIIDQRINEQIRANKGDGAVKIEMDTDSCKINSIPVLTVLPVWPGCFVLTVRGIVVKARSTQA